MTAVPSAGYVFDNWSGDTQGIATADLDRNPVTFLMGDSQDNERLMYANFAASDLRCVVAAAVEPVGGGSIEFLPEQPAGGYPINQSVSLRAVADEGYVFSHWTGDLGGEEESRSIRVSDNRTFTAVFNPTVTVYCSPSEGGSYAVEPASSGGYAAGTEVTVSVQAAKGYRFAGWAGDVSGSTKSITVTVDEPKTIEARFEEKSESRWWLWMVIGLAALVGGLVLLRLAFVVMSRRSLGEPPQFSE